jgi:hypothetical protein
MAVVEVQGKVLNQRQAVSSFAASKCPAVKTVDKKADLDLFFV